MAARPPVSLRPPFLVGAQLVEVDGRRAESHAELGQVAGFIHHRRDMQQRLGGCSPR